jgi:hypothetical protein
MFNDYQMPAGEGPSRYFVPIFRWMGVVAKAVECPHKVACPAQWMRGNLSSRPCATLDAVYSGPTRLRSTGRGPARKIAYNKHSGGFVVTSDNPQQALQAKEHPLDGRRHLRTRAGLASEFRGRVTSRQSYWHAGPLD